jgi:hypothetical protein
MVGGNPKNQEAKNQRRSKIQIPRTKNVIV